MAAPTGDVSEVDAATEAWIRRHLADAPPLSRWQVDLIRGVFDVAGVPLPAPSISGTRRAA